MVLYRKLLDLCSKDSQLFVGRKYNKKANTGLFFFFFKREKKDDSGENQNLKEQPERGNETLTKKPSNIPCWNAELLWTSDCCVPLTFSLLN